MRYYACEAMYNIAKVAKGEILIYFNDIFDALCKVGMNSCPTTAVLSSLYPTPSLAPTQSYPSRTVRSYWIV